MRVRLEGVEARVFVDHVEHVETLVRELRVVASGQESGIAPVLDEIASIVEDILGRYARVKDESYLYAREALARGEKRITLELDLPEQAANDAEVLLGAVERADEVCRDQGLLALPASREVVEFRRWAFREVTRQLEGATP